MSEIRDEFEQDLDKKRNLSSCQSSKGLKSCYNCDEIFNCSTRKDYDAVYNSMSKGKTEGGFDF